MSEQEKCPKCGADFTYNRNVAEWFGSKVNVFACGSSYRPDGTIHEECTDCVRRQLSAAQEERDTYRRSSIYWWRNFAIETVATIPDCTDDADQAISEGIGKLENKLVAAQATITRLVKLAREIGPTPPGHSCGPNSNCDAGCHAYAEFDSILREATKETKET